MRAAVLVMLAGVMLAGCDRAAREDAARASTAELLARMAEAERESDAMDAAAKLAELENADQKSLLFAEVSWKNFVYPVKRRTALVAANKVMKWRLSENPFKWSEVEVAAMEDDVPAGALLAELSNKLQSLPWVQIKDACADGGAFREFGSGKHGFLEWEAVESKGPDDFPVATARFRLVE